MRAGSDAECKPLPSLASGAIMTHGRQQRRRRMAFGETDPSEIYGGASAPAAPAHQVTFDRRELNRILSL